MYISSVNNYSYSKNSSFYGQTIIKKSAKKLPEYLLTAIAESKHMTNLTNNHDVVVRGSKHNAFGWDDEYKIKLSILRENSKLDKFLDFFHLIPRQSLTKNYHTGKGMLECIDGYHFSRINK